MINSLSFFTEEFLCSLSRQSSKKLAELLESSLVELGVKTTGVSVLRDVLLSIYIYFSEKFVYADVSLSIDSYSKPLSVI